MNPEAGTPMDPRAAFLSAAHGAAAAVFWSGWLSVWAGIVMLRTLLLGVGGAALVSVSYFASLGEGGDLLQLARTVAPVPAAILSPRHVTAPEPSRRSGEHRLFLAAPVEEFDPRSPDSAMDLGADRSLIKNPRDNIRLPADPLREMRRRCPCGVPSDQAWNTG